MLGYKTIIDNNYSTCYVHEKRPGVSICNICRKSICEDCKKIKEYNFPNQTKIFITKIYCKKCSPVEGMKSKKLCCTIL